MALQRKTDAAGCPMVDGLYLRANGELACWGHFGDVHRLDRVDVPRLRDPSFDLIAHPKLVEIRQAFGRGELPFPELCGKCPVLGDGVAAGRPKKLDKLLIEPSYVCQLDCPSCFSAIKRRTLGSPPFVMTPALLEAFLDRLRADGIESVRFVHFEGRGDPLLGPHTWTLVRLIKQAFPGVTVQITSHGVYDFDPGVFECGLDILRFSIDGATPESYARYRRGGDFDRVVRHLRAIRDHRRRHRGRLRLVWKYIVFEWNDSSAELAAAGRMAEELEAEMLFVLAEEGTGRSKRLPDHDALSAELSRIAPRAEAYECLDQLGTASILQRQEQVARQAARALRTAIDAAGHGDRLDAARALRSALRLDPGGPIVRRLGLSSAADPLPQKLVEEVLVAARFPSTLAGLGNLAVRLERWSAAYDLLARYLEIGPQAPDREAVEAWLVRLALLRHLGTDDLSAIAARAGRDFPDDFPETSLLAAERAILRIDPGRRPGGQAQLGHEAEWIDDITLAETLRTLTFVRIARGDRPGARLFFRRLLARFPEQADGLQAFPWLIAASRRQEAPREPSDGAGRTLARLQSNEPAAGQRISQLVPAAGLEAGP